ncbi:MAG: SGNH/GDSL hydrolase family protein [Anaerobacillus sp.]
MFYSNPSPLYTAIGDSITLGTGTILFSPTFVDFYSDELAYCTERGIGTRVFAENGATTQEVRCWLSTKKIPLRNTSVVTLTVGGNDLIDAAELYDKTGDMVVLQDALQKCCENLTWIVEDLTASLSNHLDHYMIRVVNLYNPFPELSFSTYWIRAFNRHIDNCTRGEKVKVADVFSLFEGREAELLSEDGFHPNTFGHKVIANALVKTGISKEVFNLN